MTRTHALLLLLVSHPLTASPAWGRSALASAPARQEPSTDASKDREEPRDEAAATLVFERPPEEPTDDARAAARFHGLEYGDDELRLAAPGLAELRAGFDRLRRLGPARGGPPAIGYSMFFGGAYGGATAFVGPAARPLPVLQDRPETLEALAFASIGELGALLRARRVTSVELTELSLARLERLDAKLLCVARLCRERALESARRADRELAAGHDRGPLHGIPYGAKDLLDTRGLATTYGSALFAERVPEADAAVIERLDAAGAVLVAKLSLGELAWGDVWVGGKTRNPWNPTQGSSGSSAGSASATAAGAVVFAIGSETCGSLVSPSTRCATTAVRPTFGRVSRAGAMELSWTLDKLGPIARSVEDAALVLAAIAGEDPRDPTTLGAPKYVPTGLFDLQANAHPKLGIAQGAWRDPAEEARVREELTALGFTLEPVELPKLPVADVLAILVAEAASAFDDVTREKKDGLMVRQVADAWPNVMRQGQLISAVEYLRAQRVRRVLAGELEALLLRYEAVVHPSDDDAWVIATNLSGHPTVCAPSLRDAQGAWHGISFTSRAFGETRAIAVAEAWQRAGKAHLVHPEL